MSAQRKSIYVPDEFKDIYNAVIENGARMEMSASEVVMAAMRQAYVQMKAGIRISDGAFFAMRDGRQDFITRYNTKYCDDNVSIFTLNENGGNHYRDIIRELNESYGDKHIEFLSFSDTVDEKSDVLELMKVMEMRDELIDMLQSEQLVSLSEYLENQDKCDFSKFGFYVDEQHAYSRLYPIYSLVRSVVVKDGEVLSVNTYDDMFSSVKFRIIESDGKPVGFKIVKKDSVSNVEYKFLLEDRGFTSVIKS